MFGLIVVGPLIIKSGPKIFKIEKPLLHFIRVICAIIGMSAGFYAITELELATAVSLAFTRPLFMIVLAIFILNEFVGWRRGVATFIGFIGVCGCSRLFTSCSRVVHGLFTGCPWPGRGCLRDGCKFVFSLKFGNQFWAK